MNFTIFPFEFVTREILFKVHVTTPPPLTILSIGKQLKYSERKRKKTAEKMTMYCFRSDGQMNLRE